VGTITYTVTGTDNNNCINTAQATVTVNALPTVTATPVDTTLCSGQQVKLFGSGAATYAWDHGISDNSAFTPSVGTTIYTVTGTLGNSCFNTAQATVTVNPLPTVTANPSSISVCSGVQVTLNGSGAVSYVWDNGISDNTAFTPSAGTTIYSVTGTDAK